MSKNANKTDLTFTFDLEDHRLPNERYGEKRYAAMTYKVLDFLDEQEIKGTFFTVGQLVESDRELIREVAERGHEIACHSYDHTALDLQSPQEFIEHTAKAKHLLEDVSGMAVTGYRAPIFSLVKDTLWAVDCLKDLGFAYSSSVLPAKSPLYGFPEADKSPFLWPNGLLELPAPIAKFGPMTLPYLGGIYLRYLPKSLITNALKASDTTICRWAYSHPYDFDAEERFCRINGASLWASLLLWFNRKHTFQKFANLANNSEIEFLPPFAEQIKNDRFSNAVYTTAL